MKKESTSSIQQIPQTAHELGLMCGFPPSPDQMVTHDNQLYAPYNRWSFQNELKLNHTADVWRGAGPVAPLEYELRDLSQVTYQNRSGAQFTFDEMVELSCTDGLVILHRGKIIYERYLNGMQAHTLHCWASGSKSMTGVLAAILAHEGLFDPDALVASSLPELKDSGFGDATIRQVMDMTTTVKFPMNDFDPVSESLQSGIAMGWLARPEGYTGPANSYEFMPTMKKDGEHGVRFAYLTANTDVLAWLMKRLLDQTLAEMMHRRIWSKLGVERDAFWIVDSATAETAGSGLLTTTRDMARFGQLLLQKGEFNGQRILPAAVVEDITAGGDREAFARGPAASPMNQGWSYRHQWWVTHNEHGAYLGLGYGGQMLYIDPVAQMVMAKFSSYPTPTPAGNEFYSAFAAIPALVKFLAQ
ncbi:MAG: serine hydrolase [Coprothermobacterota bacterium]|nr:serine hydrolase [Coprothermobacterota bacterium]